MDHVYVSAETPRLPLRTEADIDAAIEGGLFEERHYLDLKELLRPGSAANKELAKDLASFAVDGGALAFGIAEDKGARTFSKAPLLLNGLAERIEQVAAMAPDPPLAVLTREIPSQAGEGLGYLVVHIPASSTAPHMVDGRYYGRGDKTRRQLSDAEVTRLHERRRHSERTALDLLHKEFERDPVPPEERKQAHLFLLAEPVSGRTGMLLNLVDGQGWQQRLMTLRDAGTSREVNQLLKQVAIGGFDPDFGIMSSQVRRPTGAALSTYNLTAGRTLLGEGYGPENVADLEVAEDGGLRIFVGRLSEVLEHSGLVVYEAGAILFVRRFLPVIVAAAQEAGYFGNWSLAVGITGLGGCKSYRMSQSAMRMSNEIVYSEDIYERATEATYAELTTKPGALADRLLGQLLRALDTRRIYIEAVTDPEPEADQNSSE
jgi:hypothetical protein